MTGSYSCNELSRFPKAPFIAQISLMKTCALRGSWSIATGKETPAGAGGAAAERNRETDLPFLFAQHCSQNGKVAQLLPWERRVRLHRGVICLPSWPHQWLSES